MKSEVRDDSLCHIGDTHDHRFIAVLGENAFGIDEDFVTPRIASDALSGWTVTLVEAGAGDTTLTAADAVGGALLITTDAAENDGANLQANGECFLPSASNSLSFYARFKVSDATQSDFFAGFAPTDTDVLGNLPKRIGFRKVDGSTSISFEYEGTAETVIAGVGTLADNTWIELEFFYDRSSGFVYYYVDGVLKGTVTPGANLPDTELRLSFQFLTGAAAAKTATIDRLRAFQFAR